MLNKDEVVKNYEPLEFNVFQMDLELWMYILNNPSEVGYEKLKYDLQNIINFHVRSGKWV